MSTNAQAAQIMKAHDPSRMVCDDHGNTGRCCPAGCHEFEESPHYEHQARAVVAALLDRAEAAEAERDRLREAAGEFEDAYVSEHELRVRVEAERDALAEQIARVEVVRDEGGHDDTCITKLSPDSGHPCNCWKADLAEALAGDPR